ncbi:DUF2288 domain-containing protein [Sandaracinus amylolyticus]|uniref:DUF2288 domain-containing protein n=1 Tax=Sandaracinus amylolyticus TaxID=927083 RepID=A0A0F6SE69_9BACT|nr:DUF2288 family protein [Sandaracinus amylolyticus]AKF04674.1 hypothetical protein DB32_001823 [Sandaracinus amylolyticus]
MASDDLRERLEAHRGPVLYSDLAAHLKRGAVFVVAPSIDLVTCGVAIATDDRASVEHWIHSGDLRRPTADELEKWPGDEGRTWISVVVQPYVLLQDPKAD